VGAPVHVRDPGDDINCRATALKTATFVMEFKARSARDGLVRTAVAATRHLLLFLDRSVALEVSP
jgi:hypothetical protein